MLCEQVREDVEVGQDGEADEDLDGDERVLVETLPLAHLGKVAVQGVAESDQ